MALKLAITDNKGVTAEYHRIISVTQVYEPGQEGIHINLAGYVSKTYRDTEVTTTQRADKQTETKYESHIVSNIPVFLPFGKEDKFDLATIYARIKAEIVELSASKDQ